MGAAGDRTGRSPDRGPRFGQLLDRLVEPSGCWSGVAGRRRPATSRWRRPWSGVTSCSRAGSAGLPPAPVFPARFTLEGAEAVAGPLLGWSLHLVDCSLLTPPRAGPDGRSRYLMLDALRDYGAGLVDARGAGSGRAALTEYAQEVARQAATAMRTGAGELAAARWLDTEDATVDQALAWALEHDSRGRTHAGDSAVGLVAAARPSGHRIRTADGRRRRLPSLAARPGARLSSAWGGPPVNCGDIAAAAWAT